MWLVIAIPASALVMGAVMIVVSIYTYDGLVVDDYYRRGLEINRVIERDRVAATLGLTGNLEVNRVEDRVVLALRANEAFRAPDALRLRLHHATRAGRDRDLELRRTRPMIYAGTWPELSPGRWHLTLEGPGWRLSGLLHAPHGRFAALRHGVD